MIEVIIKSLYLFLPAYMANMAPVLMRKTLPSLDVPVDFGFTWRNKPIFGKNKTFRGFFFGILFALITIYIQAGLYWYDIFKYISFLDYSDIHLPLYGFLLGFGALMGDLIKSFFKRRRNIAPGQGWFPWDQLDMILGALLLLSIVYIPSFITVIIVILFQPFLHILIKHIGYYLKIEKSKW